MKRILCPIGVRPHAGKAACLALERRESDPRLIFYVTNQQHNFLQLGLDSRLEKIIRSSSITSKIDFSYAAERLSIAKIIMEEGIEGVLSIGDTKTSLVAAFGASDAGVQLIHYESGLRSKFILTIEEKLRRKIDSITDVHLTYNQCSKDNLLSEGVRADDIVLVGSLYEEIVGRFAAMHLQQQHQGGPLVIALHRKENFRGTNALIFAAKAAVKASNNEVFVLIHPSNIDLRDLSGLRSHRRVTLLPTQVLGSFIEILQRSSLILTDSAGICEQGSVMGKLVLLLRCATERPWLLGPRVRLTQLGSLTEDIKSILKLSTDIEFTPKIDRGVSRRIIDAIADL